MEKISQKEEEINKNQQDIFELNKTKEIQEKNTTCILIKLNKKEIENKDKNEIKEETPKGKEETPKGNEDTPKGNVNIPKGNEDNIENEKK